VQIGIGKENHTYSAHNVVYFSIYLIIDDIVQSRIGIVEFPSNKLIDSLDEDGDIILDKGKISYFITKEYLYKLMDGNKNNGTKNDIKPDTEITRITEDGNTRVTEDSNVRITFELTNSAISSITSQPTFILFSSTAYIKEQGVWKVFDPYAKYEGSWVEPEKVYYKEGTSWRRVH